MDDDLGVEEGMVEGDQLHRSPCHKLSHTTRRRHTNLSRRYTLKTRVGKTEYNLQNIRPLPGLNLVLIQQEKSMYILTIPITVVFPNSTLSRGPSRDLSNRR